MITEKWLPVEGFNGLYEVSNTGKVRALNYNREKKVKELRQCVDRYGYQKVVLTKNHKPHYFTVHRLVALAFLEKDVNRTQVDHIDCNTQNNNVDNLRWVTNKENMQHSHSLNRQKINAKEVVAISETGQRRRFWSQREAERTLKVPQWFITKNINKDKYFLGWRFIYDN